MSSEATARSAWEPLRLPLFRALWLATLVSNVGTWMHDIGAGWLMTSLTSSPVMVAMVQAATALPVFFFAIPAGALSDIVDRRRYLLWVQGWMLLVAALLAALTLGGMTTPRLLVAMTAAMGAGAAMMMPAWAAVTPEIVPRDTLASAIALNSMGINVARAIGPALAGVIISMAGSGAVFALNALSFLGVMLVLRHWRREPDFSTLPAERFAGALRAGLRFARHAPALHAAVIRGAAFFLFASAAWALLPLVARGLPAGGPQAFGILVASIGAGAVAGAVLLPQLRGRVSRDVLVAGGAALYALTTLLLSLLDRLPLLALAMALSGLAWISVLSSLQVAAQLALPNWVRSRGLAVFMTVFMGSMALGSLLWGKLADLAGIDSALQASAMAMLLAIPLTARWKLGGQDALDLTPSMHWPSPQVHDGVNHDRGPVLVTLTYQVRPEAVPEFLELLRQLAHERRRDGAYIWNVYEHTERPNRFIETFGVESWLEHLRQHQRVTGADRDIQERIRKVLVDGTSPLVDHYVAPERPAGDTRMSAAAEIPEHRRGSRGAVPESAKIDPSNPTTP